MILEHKKLRGQTFLLYEQKTGKRNIAVKVQERSVIYPKCFRKKYFLTLRNVQEIEKNKCKKVQTGMCSLMSTQRSLLFVIDKSPHGRTHLVGPFTVWVDIFVDQYAI